MVTTLPSEIQTMSVADRVALAELIYASVRTEWEDGDYEDGAELEECDDPLATMPNLKAELARRMDEYEADPSIGIPVEQTFAKMRARK